MDYCVQVNALLNFSIKADSEEDARHKVEELCDRMLGNCDVDEFTDFQSHVCCASSQAGGETS